MSDNFRPKLYVLTCGLFPRRVTTYLKEKGIISDFDLIPVTFGPKGEEPCPGKPPGTLPILEYAPGRHIFQSVAILEYLEDVYPQEPIMRGANPVDASRVREVLALIDEACSALGFFTHNSSEVFADLEHQEPGAAEKGREKVQQLLGQAEKMADENGAFLVDIGNGGRPTIADCVLLSTVQFAREIYGVDFCLGYPRLKRAAEEFEKRDSGKWEEEAPRFLVEKGQRLSVKWVQPS